MPCMLDIDLFYSKICSNYFVKIDRVKTFYLRYTIIHVTLLANTPRKVKGAKMAQVL